jgi:hypothetical protein
VAGIPAARVVAVVAKLDTGKMQIGSGYLLDATRVLTARHCTFDRQTGRAATELSVVRASNGATATVIVSEASPTLDVAVLAFNRDAPWGAELPGGSVTFGKVDREHTGQLNDCEAVGYPLWQGSEAGDYRDVAELHGSIRALEGRESQRLVLRDPILAGAGWERAGIRLGIAGGAAMAADNQSAWGGLSGAAVFYSGLLLGVIIEHHPRQGETALQIRPVAAIAAASDDTTVRLAEALGIDDPRVIQHVETISPDSSTDEDGGPSQANRTTHTAARDLSVYDGPTHIDNSTKVVNVGGVTLHLDRPDALTIIQALADRTLRPVPRDATAEQLVTLLGQFVPRPDEAPLIQQVTEAVEQESPGCLAEGPSEEVPTEAASEQCIAIILQQDYYEADLYRMFVVLFRDGRDVVPLECDDDFVSLKAIQVRVRSLLPVVCRGLGQLLVEFAVPQTLLGTEFDQWPLASYPDAPVKDDFRLGEKYPVVVRDLDHMKPDLEMWESRWRQLLSCEAPSHEAVYWVTPQAITRFKRLRAMLLGPETAGQVILALRPAQVSTKIVDDMIRAGVAAGIPAAIWMRRRNAAKASIEDDLDYLEKAMVEGGLRSLPHRVRALRLRAAQEEGKAAHPGRRLSLLWADPGHSWDPPPFEQPALSANGGDL